MDYANDVIIDNGLLKLKIIHIWIENPHHNLHPQSNRRITNEVNYYLSTLKTVYFEIKNFFHFLYGQKQTYFLLYYQKYSSVILLKKNIYSYPLNISTICISNK